MTERWGPWKRWTELPPEGERKFPEKKYGFSDYLRRIGDYVETMPMTPTEYQKIKDAAKFWAWFHKVRVSIRSYKVGDNLKVVRVTLIDHTRKRKDDRTY